VDKISEQVMKTYLAAQSLMVYRNIKGDKIFAEFNRILESLISEKVPINTIGLFHNFVGMLIDKAETSEEDIVFGLWKDHVLDLILTDENPFSLRCEAAGFKEIETLLIETVRRDMAFLKVITDLDISVLIDALNDKLDPLKISHIPLAVTYRKTGNYPFPNSYYEEKRRLKAVINSAEAWGDHIEDLAMFYKNNGCGDFGRFWAFKWVTDEFGGKLAGISEPDPIRLNDLIGYEDQKRQVIENTQQFVKGCSANNILLYGDRGTGKSSTVKSLVNEFGQDGLRIVEVSKYQLVDLQEIISQLRTRPQRFIVFIDDLSFEEHETEYKYFKAILEGSVESTPRNVLIYATSNRRHLIREYFNDRDTGEVHNTDTVQEKLSLSDRFGITVMYPSPDQQKYLEIVEGLAKQRGINMDKSRLKELALKWELWQNQRSGRTAVQFINDLAGKFKSQ
jgi:predicted AAA+ superfamily ATPase